MDICPTLCEMGGAPLPPKLDGVSLLPQLKGGPEDKERMVICEAGGEIRIRTQEFSYGQMVQQGQYKFIHYDGYEEDDILFDTKADPDESVNVIAKHGELAEAMRKRLRENCPSGELVRQKAEDFNENLKILGRCDLDCPEERWHAPESARHYPEPMVSSKLTH